MGKKTKPGIVSGSGALLSAIWIGYSNATAIADLPEQASGFQKMMADPPIYLPWLILGVCVIVLAWSLWPSSDDEPEQPLPPPIGPTQNHSGSRSDEPTSELQ